MGSAKGETMAEYHDGVSRYLYEAVTGWARRTFPDHTPDSVARHLSEEARELVEQQTLEEAADIWILLVTWCDLTGHSFDDMQQAILAKHAVNLRRKWAMTSDGLHHHVKAVQS